MNEPVFSYYEIRNSVSESRTTVTGRYATLDMAIEALKDCCDWYRPKGTGKIYEMCYYLNNGEITVYENFVFECW